MAKIYYNLIGKGAKTIEQVPMLWRADVQTMLDVDAQAILDADAEAKEFTDIAE